MACVGLTYAECVLRYGLGGFDCASAREENTDRSDMERNARNTTPCFIELRAQKNGLVLGCTACGPTAAEICNSIGIAITNNLTVSDVAFSPHSYPSYGYLMYRIALSMALGRVWGVLEACGPLGRFCAKAGRVSVSWASKTRGSIRLPASWERSRKLREWQAQGASSTFMLRDASRPHCDDNIRTVSYLNVLQNVSLQGEVENCISNTNSTSLFSSVDAHQFLQWRSAEP